MMPTTADDAGLTLYEVNVRYWLEHTPVGLNVVNTTLAFYFGGPDWEQLKGKSIDVPDLTVLPEAIQNQLEILDTLPHAVRRKGVWVDDVGLCRYFPAMRSQPAHWFISLAVNDLPPSTLDELLALCPQKSPEETNP